VKLDLGDRVWAELVASHPAATPFHDPEWATVLSQTYGLSGFAIVVLGPDGRAVAGAPWLEVRTLAGRRRWVSLPFTDACEPLARSPADLQALLGALGDADRELGAPRLAIRARVDAPGWRVAADAVIHRLELDRDASALRSRFSKSQVLRNIARAEREGVRVRRAANRRDLETFYALHARTRRRQGVPVQPRRFLTTLWERMIEPGRGCILLAECGGVAVAGALFLDGPTTTIYKFGASDPPARPRRANHLLFWTAIHDSAERGVRWFDFGRTDLENTGLRAFKAGWGAVEQPLCVSVLPVGAARGHASLSARVMGPPIRRGPAWVGRAVGAAFYARAGSR
jgi:CelD/BcsL family acetyltransferase involved in cellulose biosynthesis